MAEITQELVAALDDLLQAGARASSTLRSALEQIAGPRSWEHETIDSAQGVISSVRTASRTEQTLPMLVTSARDAVAKLQVVAGRIGQSDLASALKLKVDTFSAQMKAAGLGTPWLTILGLGAGAVAAYFLWKQYSKKRRIASFVRPDNDASDTSDRVRMMGRSLGAFRAKAPCRQLGRGKRLGRMGAAEKYEFEPEIRLEGINRGSRRSTRSRK